MKQNQYEVIIVGGGPAGIATALTLQALGISNCIVEAAQVPRSKYGEALPPNAKPLLRQLGIQSLVEDRHHLNYYGNKTCWGSEHLEQKEFIADLHGHGYLLDREYFERQLWDCYIHNHGVLYNGHKLTKITQEDKNLLLILSTKKQKIELQCRYVVDASGRKASVCRQMGIDKIDLDSQFALSLTLRNEKPLERQIIVEATQNGWWYAAPNGTEEITLMFFTLKRLLPQAQNVNSFLKKELASTIHLKKINAPSNLSKSKIKMMPAGTSRLEIPYGNNWIAVGDAAVSYDPISSYGITSALASGYYAGQAIASKMAGKTEAMDAYRYIIENAFQAYAEKLNAHYRLEQRWASSAYWEKRLG